MASALKLEGFDNKKRPRQDFADTLALLDDDTFMRRAEALIWLSAYANNNPRSDYHWQADACCDEAVRRGKPELYTEAYDRASASCS
jgi:hypothetical protein